MKQPCLLYVIWHMTCRNNHFCCLKYLHNKGCLLTEEMCFLAENENPSGNQDCLTYLLENT